MGVKEVGKRGKCYGNVTAFLFFVNSDKIILKTTRSSDQTNDEEPKITNKVSYSSVEIVLADDVLLVDYGFEIREFTKAE